jgi:hypothetical protein
VIPHRLACLLLAAIAVLQIRATHQPRPEPATYEEGYA